MTRFSENLGYGVVLTPGTCHVGGCGSEAIGPFLCEDHWRRWLLSPDHQSGAAARGKGCRSRAAGALADFARRIEAEDRVDALRSKGAMAEAERALSAEQRPHLHRF